MIDLEDKDKEKDKSANKRRKSLLTVGRSATLDESTIEHSSTLHEVKGLLDDANKKQSFIGQITANR